MQLLAAWMAHLEACDQYPTCFQRIELIGKNIYFRSGWYMRLLAAWMAHLEACDQYPTCSQRIELNLIPSIALGMIVRMLLFPPRSSHWYSARGGVSADGTSREKKKEEISITFSDPYQKKPS